MAGQLVKTRNIRSERLFYSSPRRCRERPRRRRQLAPPVAGRQPAGRWTGRPPRASPAADLVRAGARQRPVLGLEALLDGLERGERTVERRAVVRRHDARAQECAARRDGRMQRRVDEDARVVQRLPQEHGLPVVAHQHGDDRRDHVVRARGGRAAAVRCPERLRRHHRKAARLQPVAQVPGVVEHGVHERAPVLGADDPQRRQRRAGRGRHGRGGEQERARLDAQELDHLGRAGHEPAAARQRLRERAQAQVGALLDAEQLRRARTARAQHPGGVRLVDHEPRAIALAQVADRRQRRDVALHREHAVDDDEDPAAVARGFLERALELVHAVVPVRAQLGARQQAAVEDRGVVARVGHDGVAGGEDRAERARDGLVAGGEHDGVVGAHPLRELALELQVQRGGAVEQARAGQAGAEALERLAGARDDALVAGQAEVVVGAEHDPLGALHLDDRTGGALDEPEVGQDVRLAGGAQLLGPLVAADLGEDVDLGACHVGSPAVSVEVSPVRSRADLREFIELPFRLHSTSPQWVPPLRLERHAFLSRRQNAFFTHGEARLFLARDGGRVVGRVSAQVDHAFNAHHGNAWGMFGFLEVEDDREVLAALLGAAEGWLAARGRDRMVGPMDFTMNDESGVLVEGFEREPMIKQPWHPPYYARRLEEAGLTKAMDLLMWELEISDREKMLPLLFDLAEQAGPKHGITLRKMSFWRLRSELDGFADVYNSAWRQNWGFVPYSKEDLDYYAQELRLVYDRPWFMVAEREGETVAVAITVPDINQVLKRMNGRIVPFGWWHYLRRRRIIDRVRVGFLGVKPEYQHTGVAAALYVEHFDESARSRIKWGEMGWILETNRAINRGMKAMNGRIVKRYRVYERELRPAG